MDDELKAKIEHMEATLTEVRMSVEKTRKYLLYMLIGSLAAIVLPLIGLMIVVPIVLSTMNNLYSGLI